VAGFGVWGSWLLGLILGMRHALEPDHLAAVATLASEERSPLATALLGASWGLGHTLSLFVVGLLLSALHGSMPARLADGFELLVALMLLFLGARAIVRAVAVRPGSGPEHQHRHQVHAHVAPAGRHVHVRRFTLAVRPLVVGIIHGLAGSGALISLTLANLPDDASRLLYIALFGLGSAAGMAAISGAAGLPLARLSRTRYGARGLAACAGVVSAVLGVVWGIPLARRLW
jgi:sulfite exporter TauE/SafE